MTEGVVGSTGRVRRGVLAGLLLLAVLAAGCGSEDGADSNGLETTTAPEGDGVLGQWVSAGGLRRTYALHTPPSYDGSRPFPLIVALHGAGGTHQMAENVGLNRAGDRRGFLVAAPDGIDNNWALACGGCTLASQLGIDDVAFIATLVDHLADRLAVDRRRVYAAGMSNGGSFAHQVACSYSLAGAAVVAGTMFNAAGCRPERPVSIVAFHGTADDIIPFSHGTGPVLQWVRRDGCENEPSATEIPDRVDDGTTVTRYDYEGCANGTAVRFFTIHGGGHNWPGSPSSSSSDHKTYDIEASEEIVGFFTQHGGVS